MQELKTIETSVLLDMLAQETATFGQLFRNYSLNNTNEEYLSCKEKIQYLILELDNRKKSLKETEPTASKDPGQTDLKKIIPFLII
jgi:hypothetical protein